MNYEAVPKFDYRRLLKKYMAMIAYVEGTTFLSKTADPSDADDVELHRLLDEIDDDNEPPH